jgi:hypothetical protein
MSETLHLNNQPLAISWLCRWGCVLKGWKLKSTMVYRQKATIENSTYHETLCLPFIPSFLSQFNLQSFMILLSFPSFLFCQSLSVCLLCSYVLSVQLLGHYHRGYLIIHMYSFFIVKGEGKTFKTSQVI